ncbi:hypothetical protein BST94_01370 [Nonlabens xylanidelens]|nr:hypothetical protein BST94_01370 [Nonlabens xylanidelens]
MSISCESIKTNYEPEQKLIVSSVVNQYQDSLKLKRFGIGALVKHKNLTETYAIGIAGDSIDMTTDKIFNIGSLTKTFTAVLIMQEMEKGTLKISDSLNKYFPKELTDNKNIDRDITIKQLLNHTSGLGEVVIDTISNVSLSNPYYDYNHTFLFNKIPEPKNKPGGKYKYTNSNYILLGYILEVLNNKTYEDILEERIFKPAKMDNSYGYYTSSRNNSAHPMFNGEDYGYDSFYYYYRDYVFSAGGIASTLSDLESFFINLYEKETFIKKDTFNQMIDTNTSYGLGMQIFHKGKNKDLFIGHGGDNFSFKLRNYYNPKNGDLVIVFSNQYKDPFTQKIANKLVKTITEMN